MLLILFHTIIVVLCLVEEAKNFSAAISGASVQWLQFLEIVLT